MRFQLILITLLSIVSIGIGAAKWRARIMAVTRYEYAERSGKWVFVLGDWQGVRTWSRSRGVEKVAGFTSTQTYQGFDVTPDLRRLVTVDSYSYSGSPGLRVYSSRNGTILAEGATSSGGTGFCPLFDEDGNVLFLDARGSIGELKRLAVPQNEIPKMPWSNVVNVATPIQVRVDDCFELSEDGTTLAWVGSDMKIHVAERAGNDYTADHKVFGGLQFALSPNGAQLATMEPTGVTIVDIANGNRRILPDSTGYASIIGFSPDGQWIALHGGSGLRLSRASALRISDGAPVSLEIDGYYAYSTQQVTTRWRARDTSSAPPTPTPAPTKRR